MRRWRADREFVGVVPGVVPPDIGSAPTRRVRHGLEWRGEAAVDFHPP